MSSKRITVAPEKQLEEIMVGVDEVISSEDLLKKLQHSYETQTPLRVKLGADPSRPDIHLGHTVVLNKLRLLQSFGHHVLFIIGDFTGRIGDPTGKSKTRPELSEAEIAANAETYREQIFKILDPDRTEVVFNSHWLSQLTPIDMIHLMARRTVQQLIVRDDFSKRFKDNQPIHLHEFLYPILQGYDSVHLKADIEFGGTDQKFNLLMGREMQRQANQQPQSLVLLPLLEGTDGVQKMSKSLDNYIGVDEPARDIFGKTMSISDAHMLRFYELLSRKGKAAIEDIQAGLKAGSVHPMDAKKDIAHELAAQYWGKEAADEARQHFEAMFSKREVPSDVVEHRFSTSGGEELNWIDVAIDLGFAKTRSEVRRVMKQKGFKVDGNVVMSERQSVQSGDTYLVRMGKIKIAKVIID